MTSNMEKKEKSAEIRRQLSALALSAENRRRLQALPFFRVETETPDRFHQLLQKLDNAEASG